MWTEELWRFFIAMAVGVPTVIALAAGILIG